MTKLTWTPTLKAGMDRPAVVAVKRALHRSMGVHARSLINEDFGAKMVWDVERWKRGQEITPDGHVFGDTAWDHIAKNVDRTGRQLLDKDRRQYEEKHADDKRDDIVAMAYWGLAHRWQYWYSQTRPYHLPLQTGKYYDCSSYAEVVNAAAHAPDPSNFGFNGYGSTYSQWPRGEHVSPGIPANLAFYGRSQPTHVAIEVGIKSGAPAVISFGSNPIKLLYLRYRHDYLGSRDYL